jgi:putative molybdopterin biosynthesis protein
VVAELESPGIVAHGVALKPGKPICLAVERGKPVVVLPGFPTSAIFTFHEFVAPVLRIFAGQSIAPSSHATETRRQSQPPAGGGPQLCHARLAVKVNSEIGRTEYVLVGLVESEGELVAYPMGKGSGSVTTFSTADGFVTIGRHEEIVEAGTIVAVQLLSPDLRLADLVAIGSHCVGLDYLLTCLQETGYTTRFLAVGSMAGLAAAQRGARAGAPPPPPHAATGEYNRPFLTPDLRLVPGYQRQQGLVFRRGDVRFEGRSLAEVSAAVRSDPACIMVNRNPASGTRVLIDQLLAGAQPSGHAIQPRSHNAVAAAVAQGRADWGVAIEYVARLQNLGFLPLAAEQYDFAIPRRRFDRPAVRAFLELLAKEEVREELARRGCEVAGACPDVPE